MSENKPTGTDATTDDSQQGCNCRNMAHNCAVGSCTTCGGFTPSRGMMHCRKCAAARRCCPYCGTPDKTPSV